MADSDPPGKPCVLVVEGDAELRNLLGCSLTSFGFAVLSAGSDEEALELYRWRRDEIDVVLLDVRLPPLDGPGMAVALQSLTESLRQLLPLGPGDWVVAAGPEGVSGGRTGQDREGGEGAPGAVAVPTSWASAGNSAAAPIFRAIRTRRVGRERQGEG